VTDKLASKLMITQSMAEEYVIEYQRFIIMASCS